MLLTILAIALFIWLFGVSLKIAIPLAWGLAKIVAAVLCVLALPFIVLCAIFASGALILIPVLMVAAALGILKTCG